MKIITCFLLSLLSFPLFANPMTNLETLRTQAVQRNADAQYQLGLRYLHGQGINQDNQQAFYWLEQAAENGQLAAQKAVTNLYRNGIGTKKNLDSAIFWMISRAIAGQTDAQIELGQLYANTKLFAYPIDYAKIWFRIAAQHSAEGEARYNQLLEQQFNRRRQKLMHKDQALEQAAAEQQDALPPPWYQPWLQSKLMPYLYLVCGLLLCLTLAQWGFMLRYRQRSRHTMVTETEKSAALKAELKAKDSLIQQQKRQLNVTFSELKKQRHSSDNDKVAQACAMLGYPINAIPDLKAIKVRYKQLSKIYHPDMHGSDKEMQRLNLALKLVVNYKKTAK